MASTSFNIKQLAKMDLQQKTYIIEQESKIIKYYVNKVINQKPAYYNVTLLG